VKTLCMRPKPRAVNRPEACQKNIGSAKEARMGSSYLMTIVALGALGVLIVLLGRLALLTFSTWLDQ